MAPVAKWAVLWPWWAFFSNLLNGPFSILKILWKTVNRERPINERGSWRKVMNLTILLAKLTESLHSSQIAWTFRICFILLLFLLGGGGKRGVVQGAWRGESGFTLEGYVQGWGGGGDVSLQDLCLRYQNFISVSVSGLGRPKNSPDSTSSQWLFLLGPPASLPSIVRRN